MTIETKIADDKDSVNATATIECINDTKLTIIRESHQLKDTGIESINAQSMKIET